MNKKNSKQALHKLLKSCRKQNEKSQEELYRLFYSYAMSVCIHYTKTKEEAQEIINDAFYKVFTRLDKYDTGQSFKGWLRKILINSAIDHTRKNQKHYYQLDIVEVYDAATEEYDGFDKLAYDDLLKMVQELTPMYRLVFNLYIIEGYKHEEIAAQLNISVGASKSNLSRAKMKLKKRLSRESYKQNTNG